MVSKLAGVSPGALYRYFESKEQLLEECFTYVDRQAAAIFDQLAFDPLSIVSTPLTVYGGMKTFTRLYIIYHSPAVGNTLFRRSRLLGDLPKRTGFPP